MNRRRMLNLIAGLGGLARGEDADLKVVANPSVRTGEISGHELRSIYLGNSTGLKRSGPVHPVLNRAGSSLDLFASRYLGKTAPALEIYYRSLVFTGRWSMPLSFDGDAAVIDYVARTPGAIGFVRQSSPSAGLLTLRVTLGAR